MSLSARFDQMDAKRVVMKPVMTTGAVQRRGEVDSRRKIGRQTQLDARRQGVSNAKPAMRAAQAKVVAPKPQPQRQNYVQGRGRGRGVQASAGRSTSKAGVMPSRSNQKVASNGGPAGRGRGAGRANGRGNNIRGRGRGGRGGRGGGKAGGGGPNNKQPAKEKDLDEGLDEYWFKAGKGPDPKVASLDRSMDSYWRKAAESTASGETAAAGVKMEADTPEAAAPATGVDPEL